MQGVPVLREGKRGCGYRKSGGLYLIGGVLAAPCAKLPIELTVCPVCRAGVKQTRGFTWIRPRELFADIDGTLPPCRLGDCVSCAVGPNAPERGGLLWIGKGFYKTPADFAAEAGRVGISRRLSGLPRDLVLGETWVYLAHPEAIVETCHCRLVETLGQRECAVCRGRGAVYKKGVFGAFRPTRVEKVVDETISDEEIEALYKRGIDPVIVEPIEDADDGE